jgi:asparagine synthase (glutamine-hydrolysing)
MCGIFGSVGDPLGPEIVGRVSRVIRHRGPESWGAKTLPGATLVHARLKIIDLSAAGAQPMANEDDTVWVTFNGEIYNFRDLRRELEGRGHRFRSDTDTEVIVHGYEEWGDAVVPRLDGMFAFGLWDTRQRRLLLARDRSGKKPLFYGWHGPRFLFGSEMKALFAAGLPLEVDHAGLAGMLAYGYAPSPATSYRGVFELRPAHQLTLDPRRQSAGARPTPEIRRYWAVDFRPRSPAPSEDEATSRVRELMTAAVRKRLVADVPVGAFLSGGLDSTVVVGLMAQETSRVQTFSIGFSGDPRYNETAYARLAAQRFGTEHTEFEVTPRDFQLVEKLVWHHDGPFGDSSAIPTYVVSQLTRQKVTVALNGDGGDELFAGYLRFWAASLVERIPGPLRKLAGKAAVLVPSGTGSRTLTARARRFLSAVERPLGDRVTAWSSFFAFRLPELMRPELLPAPDTVLGFHRQFFDGSAGNGHPAGGAGGSWSPLAALLQHNFGTYLPQDLNVKVDRTSMAHALEARSPFLDTALIEYVAGLPDDFKLRGRTTKYILRKAFADLMPPAIQGRAKMGFGLPLGTWFRQDLRGYIEDRLCAPDARINEILRPEAVRKIWQEHVDGLDDHEHRIWLLLTMELWLRNLPRLTHAWEEGGAAAVAQVDQVTPEPAPAPAPPPVVSAWQS